MFSITLQPHDLKFQIFCEHYKFWNTNANLSKHYSDRIRDAVIVV